MKEESWSEGWRLDWPLSGPGAGLVGEIRRVAEDFQVREVRPEPLSGRGEHHVVTIEKRGWTTEAVGRWLAGACGLPFANVGWAGLKDRQAVTVQDFSILSPGGRPLPELVPPEGVRVARTGLHHEKIRPGHLAGNDFRIRLSGCRVDETAAETCADRLRRFGFANYFGPQRFGRGGGNFEAGLALLREGRSARRRRDGPEMGLLVSAVRSELFNRILGRRIALGLFRHLLDGDVAQLDGRSASFHVAEAAVELERFQRGEIHPTGPLFGKKLLSATGTPGELERAELGEAVELLAAFGVDGGRRALRVIPRNLELAWEGDGLVLSFFLPKGAYATALLREFMETGPTSGAP